MMPISKPKRSPPILLHPKKYSHLSLQDPNHPLLRRHRAFNQLHNLIKTQPHLFKHQYKVPHEVISIIDHLNKHYLILPSDIPIKSKNAWRLLWKWNHSSSQSSHIKFDLPTQQPNHRVIYIQSRKWTIPELRLGRQKRVKPPTKLPIGTHISDIESFVTIDQTSCDHILYIAPDLHSSPHGSMDSSDLDSIHCLLDCLDIKNVKLNDDTAGKNGISKYNGIIFATPRSYILQRLDKKLIGGLSSFHSDLVHFLLLGGDNDTYRMQQTLEQIGESVNNRCRFGFGRVQPRNHKKNWTLEGEKMPTIDVSGFRKMPKSLQQRIMTVAELANSFIHRHHKDAFQDKFRNENCSSLLNKHMGFPFSKAKFEYYDVVISRNITLNNHIDTKNDHRDGYNYSAVYSFYCCVRDVEYKVSIIMTTRCHVGAPIERISNSNV